MDSEAMQSVLEAARASVGVKTFGDEHAIAVLPDGFNVKDISSMLPPPPRPRELIELLTVESFADYVKRFAGEASVIFADEQAADYQAVIDYHAGGGRGTCDHKARYRCPMTQEWTDWSGLTGKLVSQVEYAKFIEAHLPDIVSPAGATMLELALSLQVKKDVSFASDTRLSNGQTQFRYEETIRGSTQAGDLVIPDQFRISIPIFVGGPTSLVDARLRYRLQDQKLVIGHELVRPQQIRLAAIQQVTARVKELLPAVQFFIGKR